MLFLAALSELDYKKMLGIFLQIKNEALSSKKYVRVKKNKALSSPILSPCRNKTIPKITLFWVKYYFKRIE